MKNREDGNTTYASTPSTALRSRGSRLSVLVAVALAITLLAGCGGSGDAAPAANGAKLVVGARNLSVPQSMLYWAAAKGYFKDEGLDVTIRLGEAAHTSQFVAGQVDLYSGNEGGLLGVANSGKSVKSIYGWSNGESGWVVTSDDSVKSPKDCKAVTTATPGTGIYAWTKQLERIYGVSWKLTQLTTTPAIASSVASGRTDCANGNISYYQTAIDDKKVRVVLDPSDTSSLPDGWPPLGIENVIGGLTGQLDKNRPAVEKFLSAFHRANQDFVKTDSAEIAKALVAYEPDWAAVGSQESLALSIEQYKPLVSPFEGRISQSTWGATLSFYQNGGLDFLAADPDRFSYKNSVDMSFYEAGIAP